MEHMFTRRKTADVSVLSSYGSCETKNKRCGSCILTTKLVTRTNYYDKTLKKWPKNCQVDKLVYFWRTVTKEPNVNPGVLGYRTHILKYFFMLFRRLLLQYKDKLQKMTLALKRGQIKNEIDFEN
jgi:hypothetical protein